MRVLVTGGAGFIGSNLADRLLTEGAQVRVFDDLSTGFRENVPGDAELLEGDIRDEAAVRAAVTGVDVVFHQAASRGVLQSVLDPLSTDLANTHGTLLVLKAADDAGVRRVVAASSSSVYGGAKQLPTPESAPLLPRSPYAVSKLAGEHYCRVWSELFGLETVALRYFNVYGPRQRPDSAYAAVIPLFTTALRTGTRPTVHGDGGQSRSFSYIDDVVDANLAAAAAPAESCSGKAYNIAGSSTHSLLELLDELGTILGVDVDPEHTAPRAGDIRHSSADLTAAARDLGWEPRVTLVDGLHRTVDWFALRGS
ncbi:MAG: NAD-dependent epimerase/dehydratase family protein [Acidimicrobiia bacterium]